MTPPPDDAEAGSCGLTVLRTLGSYRATKRWRWNATLGAWSKVSYEAGARFHAREHAVRDLADLVEVLDAVRRDPRAFVVRGALAPSVREQIARDPELRIRRRKHAKAGVEPSLIEVPRRWLMIDVDGWPLRECDDLADDPDAAIDAAIHALLPEAFHDAECWWQLSASAGFAPGHLKAHLFFLLAEPADNLHIKAVLRQHAPGVDVAPFNAAQPHYIADPIIEGGHDPLPRRTGWRKGLEPAVRLPALLPVAARPRPAGAAPGGIGGGFADALAMLGHGEGGRGFHEPLRRAILAYARRVCRGGERDDDALKAELRAAIRTAPCRPGGDVETPYCQEAYLQSSIDGAFAYLAGNVEIQTMRPHHAAPAGTLAGARAEVARHVGAFMRRAVAWHVEGTEAAADTGGKETPEHAGLAVGVGIGKSTAARENLSGKWDKVAPSDFLGYVAAAKDAGVPHRVAWLVPTHKLGNETLAAMERLGLRVAVWRGREAGVPGTGSPEDGTPAEPMCLNLDAVRDAVRIGEDVERAVCGSGKEGKPSCPWRTGEDQCAYQRQKAAAARADVVVLAHQHLFRQLPKEVSEGLGLVVADEAWWQAGLHPNQPLRAAGFAETPLLHPVRAKPTAEDRKLSRAERLERDEADTNDLHVLSLKAETVFEATPDEKFVGKAEAVTAGLTPEDCALAVKLEWRRKVSDVIKPGMPPAERRKAMELAEGNAFIPRRAGIWAALEELLRGEAEHTGRLQVATRAGGEGAARVVLLHARDEVREAIAGLPVLYLDATMPTQVVRHFLPRLTVLANVQASTPYAEIVQVTGGWGKTSLVPNPKAGRDDPENKRRENLVGQIADFVRLNAAGDAVAITYEAIEDRFAAPGVRTAHFNNIAGLDEYRDVRSLFLIGRPLPDARELRALALALTGRAIAEEVGQRETRGVLMVDGSGAAMEVRTFADPDMEALRVAITDAEVIQAIGRARAVNRTADNPVKVFVLANVVLPMPVSRLVAWEHVRLDVVARMQAHGRVLLGPADAHRAYPHLFPSADAARMALKQCLAGGSSENSPRSTFLLGRISDDRFREVQYRPAGHGQKTRRAWVAVDLLEGFPAWLEGLLGPLVHYAESAAPPPPPLAEKPPVRPQPPPDAAPVPEIERPPPTWAPVIRAVSPSARPPGEVPWGVLAPPLRGGPVPAFDVSWHASGDD